MDAAGRPPMSRNVQRYTVGDREVRHELLCARSAIGRQAVSQSVLDLRESLTSRGLFDSVLPASRRRSLVGSAMRMLSLSGRYPVVLSLGLALLSTSARRRVRWWKLAGAAVLARLVARQRR